MYRTFVARASTMLGVSVALALRASSAVAQVQVSTPAPGIQLAYGVNGGNPTALAVVNLCAPGISIRTTRYEERGALAVDWAARTGVDLAVNGDLFLYGSYSVVHWARSGGIDWPPGTHDMEPHPNLSFGPGFAVRGELPPPAAATEVIGGIPEFVIDGHGSTTLADTDFINGPHRRTAVGLSRDRRTLFIFSTDGTASVPGVHFGMAVFARAVPGAPEVWWALNLDGGGSSQMWVRGRGVVIPSTRPVASHLGVYARGSGPATHCPTPDPRCPASGTTALCVDRTRAVDCVDGIISGGGDCGVFGAVCAPRRPGGPGCVIGFCLPDPSLAPFDHDACGYDGRLTRCLADGNFTNPRTCPSGTVCQTRSDGTAACAAPGSLDRDAAADVATDVMRDVSAEGVPDAAMDSARDTRGDVGEDGAREDGSRGDSALDGGVGRDALRGSCGCRTGGDTSVGDGRIVLLAWLGLALACRRRRVVAEG